METEDLSDFALHEGMRSDTPARRYARELGRLRKGLEDRGITIEGDSSPVASALAALDEAIETVRSWEKIHAKHSRPIQKDLRTPRGRKVETVDLLGTVPASGKARYLAAECPHGVIIGSECNVCGEIRLLEAGK